MFVKNVFIQLAKAENDRRQQLGIRKLIWFKTSFLWESNIICISDNRHQKWIYKRNIKYFMITNKVKTYPS